MMKIENALLAVKPAALMKTLSTIVLLAAGLITHSTIVHAHYCAQANWKMGGTYKVNEVVEYDGHNYKAWQAHTAYTDN